MNNSPNLVIPEKRTECELTSEEEKILEALRNEKFSNYKVVKRNGLIEMIECTERIVEKKRIVSILSEHNFQNLEIKTANGKVVLINRTIKTKF